MSSTGFKKIRAVTFDAGGTLIEPWPSVGHVYAAAARSHLSEDADPEALNRQFRDAWEKRGSFDYSRESWLDLVRQTFRGISSDPDLFFHELYDRFEQPDAWRIYDDVIPTLELLQERGFKLGVISNWDERLRPLLKNLGLAKYFDVTTISVEAGATKPAAQIFQQTLENLGLPAESVLHVGDSTREDYLGPQQVGMPSLLVKRGSTQTTVPHILASLSEILALLPNIDGRQSRL
ncbi:MAG: Haloacid dehalogenase, subfamily [Verrucomicrobiales bacterium]|nr:Haloacid dehalogenase, subfamily [Verrucomicrobiales bacterium]